MRDSLERREVFRDACTLGENILRDIVGVQEQQGGHITLALALSSPLQPFWVSESNSILFYKIRKRACLLGVTAGSGFLISRLPSPHPTLIHWSAPCFVSVRLVSLGLSVGARSVSSFTACMTRDVKQQLAAAGRVTEVGLDVAVSCGAALQDRTDLVWGGCTGGLMGAVGKNRVAGGMVDISFASGSLQVDTQKNAVVYGSDAAVLSILDGKVSVPPDMQPLYSALSLIVNHVERPSAPSRVSASLERLTAGFDPERRMVLDSGLVIKEDPSTRAGDAFAEKPANGSSGSGGGGGGGGGGGEEAAATDASEWGTSRRSSEAPVKAPSAAAAAGGPAPAPAPSAAAGPGGGAAEHGVVQVDSEELERLRAAAAENEALRAQVAALTGRQ